MTPPSQETTDGSTVLDLQETTAGLFYTPTGNYVSLCTDKKGNYG